MNEINQFNNEPVTKSRILLVDDEPGLRTAVKTFLEDEGFEIFIAVDGCLLYTSPSPRDPKTSRMPSSA